MKFFSGRNAKVIYTKGKTLKTKFNNDPRVECAEWLHFFITKKEAEDY